MKNAHPNRTPLRLTLSPDAQGMLMRLASDGGLSRSAVVETLVRAAYAKGKK